MATKLETELQAKIKTLEADVARLTAELATARDRALCDAAEACEDRGALIAAAVIHEMRKG